MDGMMEKSKDDEEGKKGTERKRHGKKNARNEKGTERKRHGKKERESMVSTLLQLRPSAS